MVSWKNGTGLGCTCPDIFTARCAQWITGEPECLLTGEPGVFADWAKHQKRRRIATLLLHSPRRGRNCLSFLAGRLITSLEIMRGRFQRQEKQRHSISTSPAYVSGTTAVSGGNEHFSEWVKKHRIKSSLHLQCITGFLVGGLGGGIGQRKSNETQQRDQKSTRPSL